MIAEASRYPLRKVVERIDLPTLRLGKGTRTQIVLECGHRETRRTSDTCVRAVRCRQCYDEPTVAEKKR